MAVAGYFSPVRARVVQVCARECSFLARHVLQIPVNLPVKILEI